MRPVSITITTLWIIRTCVLGFVNSRPADNRTFPSVGLEQRNLAMYLGIACLHSEDAALLLARVTRRTSGSGLLAFPCLLPRHSMHTGSSWCQSRFWQSAAQ